MEGWEKLRGEEHHLWLFRCSFRLWETRKKYFTAFRCCFIGARNLTMWPLLSLDVKYWMTFRVLSHGNTILLPWTKICHFAIWEAMAIWREGWHFRLFWMSYIYYFFQYLWSKCITPPRSFSCDSEFCRMHLGNIPSETKEDVANLLYSLILDSPLLWATNYNFKKWKAIVPSTWRNCLSLLLKLSKMPKGNKGGAPPHHYSTMWSCCQIQYRCSMRNTVFLLSAKRACHAAFCLPYPSNGRQLLFKDGIARELI